MLLASGIPIKTLLINQSLGDGSNLKAQFFLGKGQGSVLSAVRGEPLAPIHYLFIWVAKDM